MRSRKPSPSRLVTRTTIQSDSTRVPPVTDEKSPPASRSTGADSPVTALSFTDATPSMTSPSAGMMSSGLDQHQVAARAGRRASTVWYSVLLAAEQFLGVHVPSHRAQRRGLRLAAPFGDRFGEVREQHREPQPDRDREDEARAAFAADLPERAPTPMTVVKMLPTKTTNITGLRICTRGSSLRNESRIAERTIGLSRSFCECRPSTRQSAVTFMFRPSAQHHLQVLDDRVRAPAPARTSARRPSARRRPAA